MSAAGGEGRGPARVARCLGASDGSGGTPRELRLEVAAPCDAQGLLRSMGCSKPVLARVFGEGALVRAGAPLARTDALAAGDMVTLRLARGGATPAAVRLPRGVAEPRVLYRDAFLLAVDKPAGILVHSDGGGAVTLTDWVAARLAAAGVPATPQAVQRLDVETTGVTLFSLAPEFQPQLDALVAGHAMHKRYLAVVEGALPADLGRIEAPIGRDRHDARRMRVSASGKPALTRVRTLCRRGGRALVELELGTGR
ncbi:MAG: RluA family pseudouridine synthase, partial [Parafannyhessea sp.]|uniref:RluA family pseudouridine synthase n=1 Tax=Parafannyhessea sp. TaxID=2847324 RepID=UPI003EFF8D8A